MHVSLNCHTTAPCHTGRRSTPSSNQPKAAAAAAANPAVHQRPSWQSAAPEQQPSQQPDTWHHGAPGATAYGSALGDFAADDDGAASGANEDRMQCPSCGRSFVPSAYERHVQVCEKVFVNKRKVSQYSPAALVTAIEWLASHNLQNLDSSQCTACVLLVLQNLTTVL